MFGKTSNSEKTHCPKGHPYDEENTYITKNGARQCRDCKREARRQAIPNQRASRVKLTLEERKAIWLRLPEALGIKSPGQYFGVDGKKTHCLHGHPYDRRNTYITLYGERQCQACHSAAAQKSKNLKKNV